jgi:3-phosphoshikimate 1-carboxyvinyltransferase
MQMALNGAEEVIDIHHAGTAMRFTAYFAVQENRTVTLTGSSRIRASYQNFS